jgi:hypothetical protein
MRTRQGRRAPGRAMTGTGKPPRRRPRPSSRPLWYPAAVAAAVALLAGGAMMLLTVSHGPRDPGRPGDCGLVTCAASLPHEVTGGAPGAVARSTSPAGRQPAGRQPAARPQPTGQPTLAPRAYPIGTKGPTPSPAPSAQPSERLHPGHSHGHRQP